MLQENKEKREAKSEKGDKKKNHHRVLTQGDKLNLIKVSYYLYTS